jgi:hypothetical protein
MDRRFQKQNCQTVINSRFGYRALKFNTKSGSQQHNINFQVYFDYAPGITCLLSSWIVYSDTLIRHR